MVFGWMMAGLLVVSGGFAACHAQSFPGKAVWIAAPVDPAQTAMPLFRRGFHAKGPVAKATLMISGLGQFEAHVNGANVTEALLTPGWSDYRKRVYYDRYDVTAMVRPGDNALGVMLGNGMYNVVKTPGRYTKFEGSMGPLKLIAMLHLQYADGSAEDVVSDAGWKTSPGPVTFTSIYGGEDYDARLEQSGWDGPGFADSAWTAVRVVDGPGGVLQPETIEPVKPFERFAPVKVTHLKDGVTVYDLGQNFAGWPELEVRGERGTTIKMVAGELLDQDGLVTQRSANANPDAQNSFTYVLRGSAPRGALVESWHPRFSYYGFRYVQVEQSGGATTELRVSGRFLHDAVHVDGSFTSSDELMMGIHRLIDRAIYSNMVSVLTDCPTREKLGWLEQTHLAAASMMYDYGLQKLYSKIADDIEDAQQPTGFVPDIAPEYPVFSGGFRDSPEWGSAVVLSAWAAYQFYGDVAPLREHYGSMQRYAAYLQSKTQGGLLLYGLGDWYDIGPGAPGRSKLTSNGVTATATFYELLVEMQTIAKLLRKEDDAAKYAAQAAALKQAFNARYFHADTDQYDTGSQTANAMPLAVGLVPEEARAAVLANLVADIRKHDNHVTAGDVGFHYVVRALTDGRRSDVLYDMLSRTDKPSYGDQLAHGATALTEAWDADPRSSQNHFMLGHAEEWFYRGLAGIDFDLSRAEGQQIVIQPSVVGTMQNAGARFDSMLGRIVSSWSREGDQVSLEMAVPVNALLVLPAGFGKIVKVDGKAVGTDGGLRRAADVGGEAAFVLPAGTHRVDVVRSAGE
jgi:hypothetical protein